MKGFVIALQFLTRLPSPRVSVTETEFAASMRWFPAVGLVVGALVWLGAVPAARVDPWVGALVGLVVWVLVTGGLHLDGLGDVADASGAAHKDPERLRAVLADPHVGSFGVIAIGMQLIAKLVLIHALLVAAPALVLVGVACAARMGPLAWSRWLPPLHAGLGSRFRDVVRPADIAVWGALLLAAAWFAPGLLAAPLLIAGWGSWVQRRLGGISGDSHGAGIELVESGLLFAVLLAT